MNALPSRFARAIALSFTIAALAACGSSKAPEHEELSVAANSGRYQTAYDKAKEILANPDAHDEATVNYARHVLKDASERLREHYGGNLKVQVATGNFDKALGMWSDMNERVPELVATSYDVQLRMMRIYANRNLWEEARNLARQIQSGSSKMEDRDEAEAFLSGYDEMKRLESELDDVKRRITAVEGRLEIDLSGGATCGASTRDDLTPEEQDMLRQFDEMRVKYDAARMALCRLTPIIEEPPAEDESNSQS